MQQLSPVGNMDYFYFGCQLKNSDESQNISHLEDVVIIMSISEKREV